jgi:long-chain acyl-CoA synthetase
MRNLPEWPVTFWAGQLVGAIVTPLNAWWTGPELEYGLADSGTKIAIVDDERLERISASFDALPALEKVYVPRLAAGPTDPKVRRLEDVIGKVNDWGLLADQPLPDVPLEAEDDATILYTSGTTGKPKGALGTHRNMTSNIMASGISATRNFLRAGHLARHLPERPHLQGSRVPGLRERPRHLRGLRSGDHHLGSSAAGGRREEGRPRRRRHAQHPRMAGGVLGRNPGRGDRHAAERLVDRAGTGVRPGRFRNQDRHRRR